MKTKKDTVKLYLTIDKEFYLLLSKKSKNDYMKIATWTKQYLMKNLLENKCELKNINKSEDGQK